MVDPNEYLDHIVARLKTIEVFKELSSFEGPRRRRFDSYQQEQLAARKLSQDLLWR